MNLLTLPATVVRALLMAATLTLCILLGALGLAALLLWSDTTSGVFLLSSSSLCLVALVKLLLLSCRGKPNRKTAELCYSALTAQYDLPPNIQYETYLEQLGA